MSNLNLNSNLFDGLTIKGNKPNIVRDEKWAEKSKQIILYEPMQWQLLI